MSKNAKAPAPPTRAKDRDLPPILGKGDERGSYFDSSCAVLELVDYDALDASTSSAFRVDKRWKGEEDDDDGGKGHLDTMRTSVASSVPQKAPSTGVDLLDRRHIGLLVSVLIAGFMSSSLKRGLLQLMESDLELSEYQGDAAEALLLIPWSYSFLFGFLADVFPILGSRRRVYIILGWVTTFLAFFAVAFLNYVEEYDTKIAAAASTSGINAGTDDGYAEVTAENRGALIAVYMLLLMLASLGVILSILIAEVHVVALCRDRESLLERGTAVGTLLLAQFTGDTTGQLVADRVIFRITSLGITPLYSFRTVALFLMFLALVPLPGLLLGFRELPRPSMTERVTPPSSFSLHARRPTLKQRIKAHWRVLRRTLGERSTTAVTRFLFMFVFFSEFSLTFPLEQLSAWCGVDAKAMSSSNIIQKVLYVCAIAMWKFNGLNASWRTHLVLGYLLVFLLPELFYFLLATFDEDARSASAYAIMDALQGYVRALIVILEIAMAVEIAPVGGEGAIVGAIVSIATIMRLLATACSNVLGYAINDDSSSSTGSASGESSENRSLVVFALAVCFAIRMLALFGVLFLPRQKRELQRMHRWRLDVGDFDQEKDVEDAMAKRNATWAIAGFAAAFTVSLVYNWLAIAPATSCLALVGGSGC